MAELHLEGAGVHWQCSVILESKKSVIHVFHQRETQFQYLVEMLTTAQMAASGYTSDIRLAQDAALTWIIGASVEQLYDQFSFVDETLRALRELRQVICTSPGINLDEVSIGLNQEEEGSPRLDIVRGDRRCTVQDGWDSRLARFFWDDGLLFEMDLRDLTRLAKVSQRWVQDRAMPSALRTEFPELVLGVLADAYEQGRAVEGEFLASWDVIEEFYTTLNWPLALHMLGFVKQLRAAGYDHLLRAGQSMSTLVLSRSRHHGLQSEHAWLAFDIVSDSLVVRENVADIRQHFFPQAELTREVGALLDRLVSEPVK